MTVERKFQRMIVLPFLVFLLPLGCSVVLFGAAHYTYRAQFSMADGLDGMTEEDIFEVEMYRHLNSLFGKWSPIFALIALVAFFASILYFIFGYYKSSTLHSFLKSRGYDSLTLRDAAMIYASVRERAFSLPDAATVLVLPDYGPNPESLVKYLKDHADYRKARRH